MNALLILLLTFLSSGDTKPEPSEAVVQDALTTYYFIRHAEKDASDPGNKDPQLSVEGHKRAQEWAHIFKDVEFDLIFSSDYNRTRTTASAVAESQEKQVEIYDARRLFDPEFQKKTSGKTVLVVGHSNTNPAFVNLILGSEKYRVLDEQEYGSLFIVTVGPGGEKSSQILYIN